MTGKGVTEIAGTDDDHRPVVSEAQLTPDLIHEVRHHVPNTTRAIATQKAEIFANLRSIDPGQVGQPIGRNALHLVVREFAEYPQVHRQSGDRGFWDSSTGAFGRHDNNHVMHSCARSQSAATRSLPSLPMNTALAAAATLVALAFALTTLDRWLRRRRPHDLAWSISLMLFTVGAGALWWAEGQGWTLATFRVFYLAGAVLDVPWLALGTIYLLAGSRAGRATQRWLVALSWFSVGVVAFSETRAEVSGGELPTGKDVFGIAPRVLAAVGSGLSATVIVVGALWSAWRLARHRAPSLDGSRATSAPGRLVVGNVLIAVGTLVLSASGTLAGRLGKDQAFIVTLLVGIVVLFAGFLVASAGPSTRPHHVR